MSDQAEADRAELLGRLEFVSAAIERASAECARLKQQLLSLPEPARDGRFPVRVIAKLLMLDERRIQQLVADGWIEREQCGHYSLIEAVQGYIRFLRSRRSEASPAHPPREPKSRAET